MTLEYVRITGMTYVQQAQLCCDQIEITNTTTPDVVKATVHLTIRDQHTDKFDLYTPTILCVCVVFDTIRDTSFYHTISDVFPLTV